MKGSLYTIFYAAALGSVCALLLTAAADFSAPYRKANAEAEENLNILLALSVPFPEEASSEQLVEIYNENVGKEERGDFTVYSYSPAGPGNNGVIAIRFSGPGLWAPIKGFLALDPEIRTIRAITFYEQEETPGLGGRIVEQEFRDRFVGLSIRDEAGNPGIIIKSGGERAANKVDGISGATMTCDKVQAMLNEAIRGIVKEMK